MKRLLMCLCVFAFLLASTAFAGGPISVGIHPAPAPNAFGSANWPQWLEWAQWSLRWNLGDVGNPDVHPGAYYTLNGFYEPKDVMVTSGHSWEGSAYPEAPFDAENGNRLHFPLSAETDGSWCFTLQEVAFALTSSDGQLNFISDLAGTTLDGTNRVGVDYGPDGLKGSPDDIVYSGGEGDTTCVHALYYRGPGNAYWPDAPPGLVGPKTSPVIDGRNQPLHGSYSSMGDPEDLQDLLDDTADYLYDNDVSITMEYFIGLTPVVSVHLELNSSLFIDGFESGGTTSWSQEVGAL